MEIIQSKRVTKAHKQHRCNLCNGIINVGESYQSDTIKMDYIYTFKIHHDCLYIASKLDMYRRTSEDSSDEGLTYEAFKWYINCEFEELTGKVSKYTAFIEQLEFVINHYKQTENGKKSI